MMIAGMTLVCIAAALGADDNVKTYPRADLLMEPAELNKKIESRKLRILDARPFKDYLRASIPRAAWVDLESWSKKFAAKQDPEEWSKLIGDLEIDHDTQVVIYDDVMLKDAARIWWILRYWGVKDARLLNGGWKAWTAGNFTVQADGFKTSGSRFHIDRPVHSLLADKNKVLDILKEKKVQIIDTRSEKEYSGDDKLKNKRGGAIPGAMHLEWTEALDKKTYKFKSAAELTKLFKDVGIDPMKPAVTYCQSGGRAAVMAFTLELMGAKDVANYYRSWSEWGNAEDTPIVRPKKKLGG